MTAKKMIHTQLTQKDVYRKGEKYLKKLVTYNEIHLYALHLLAMYEKFASIFMRHVR